MRLGYESACCFVFSVVQFNKMNVSDEESDQELSLLTPQDIINKAKTLKTADLLPEKSNQLFYVRNDLFMQLYKKNGTERISEKVILVYLSRQSQVCSPIYLCAYIPYSL
jgi:hypothetical protein